MCVVGLRYFVAQAPPPCFTRLRLEEISLREAYSRYRDQRSKNKGDNWNERPQRPRAPSPTA